MGAVVRIEEVEQAFRCWRRSSRTRGGRKRMPERLWVEAARVARVHGVTKTAERLRLNSTRLKEWCERGARSEGFVELAASELALGAESVVELESAAGSRLRLVLHGASVAAVAAAAKELWGVTP
jgi:hypothetical protein